MKPLKGFGKTALARWQEENKGKELKCERCNRWTRITVDHIIPVNILSCLDGGYELSVNDEENFQLLCEPCNRMKSGNLDITNPRTAKLLVKYMQPYL